jgi:hypothetical protein
MQPDPVGDVVRNVLPKYRSAEIDVEDDEYEKDIARIVQAFATDSKAQRDKLEAALRETTFVHARDAGDDNTVWFCRPPELYIATERLKELFAGVGSIFLVACCRPMPLPRPGSSISPMPAQCCWS